MALLPASLPTVLPSTAGAIYDGWFLTALSCDGSPNAVNGTAILRKARTLADGTVELSPVDGPVYVVLGSLLTNTDPAVQAAVQAVMMAVVSQAKIQNIQL